MPTGTRKLTSDTRLFNDMIFVCQAKCLFSKQNFDILTLNAGQLHPRTTEGTALYHLFSIGSPGGDRSTTVYQCRILGLGFFCLFEAFFPFIGAFGAGLILFRLSGLHQWELSVLSRKPFEHVRSARITTLRNANTLLLLARI